MIDDHLCSDKGLFLQRLDQDNLYKIWDRAPTQLQWPIATNVNNKTNQWELEANTRDRRQARENAKSWLVLHLISWVGGASFFFKPITEGSKVKPNQFRITFDTQLKLKPL